MQIIANVRLSSPQHFVVDRSDKMLDASGMDANTLISEFGGVAEVVRRLSGTSLAPWKLTEDAVYQWSRRGKVPAAWMASVIEARQAVQTETAA